MEKCEVVSEVLTNFVMTGSRTSSESPVVPDRLSIDIACNKLLFTPVSGQSVGTLDGQRSVANSMRGQLNHKREICNLLVKGQLQTLHHPSILSCA